MLSCFQFTGTLTMNTNKKGWAKAKRNLKNAINKAKPGSKSKLPTGGIPTVPSLAGMEQTPAMASWNDIVGDEEENGAGRSGGVRFTGGYYSDEDEEEE